MLVRSPMPAPRRVARVPTPFMGYRHSILAPRRPHRRGVGARARGERLHNKFAVDACLRGAGRTDAALEIALPSPFPSPFHRSIVPGMGLLFSSESEGGIACRRSVSPRRRLSSVHCFSATLRCIPSRRSTERRPTSRTGSSLVPVRVCGVALLSSLSRSLGHSSTLRNSKGNATLNSATATATRALRA